MKLPEKPPALQKLLASAFQERGERFAQDLLERILTIGPLAGGRYEHWDRLRYRPLPQGLDLRDWWLGLKMARERLLRPILLRDTSGRHFRVATPDNILRLLHEIDQRASGQIEIAEQVTNPSTRDRYVIDSLIAESITSSQLEGASTTVEVAKNMIRSGRKPTDRSERMIFNNYHAMQFVRENKNSPLTSELVFELHRLLTDRTLDDEAKAGAFRTQSDDIGVEWRGTEVHVPPPARELPERLELMCRFANDRPSDVFFHPAVRAVVLHFWLAYDHPFVDGNGRTARALFYWSMLSQGYWLTEYLSISRILRSAPAQYARSFLLTETDENDLTYFLEHQLKVIRRSISDLQTYLAQKMAEVREVETLLRQSGDLNHRQLALLGHAHKHPGYRYTIESHRRSHDVAYQTARTDLLGLARRGLLQQLRRGRSYQFSAPQDIAQRLRRPGKPRARARST